ncbi:type I toxin-antitoxin system Ibs family toxin [Cronobacter turicensis]
MKLIIILIVLLVISCPAY